MKILVAEDSKYYQRILEDMLKIWGYDVVIVNDGVQALEKLQEENGPKLAIIDWVMPHVDGLEVCAKVRSVLNKSYIYLILLTANSSKEDVVKGLEAGADDYIVKPFNEMELKFRLQTGQRIINLENRIMQLALTDSLTGLLNRRAFMDRLQSELERCRRSAEDLVLIMVDLDDFKKVNDNYGHLVGDEVLKSVSACFSSFLRQYDFIGRYGGEEFIICLPGTTIKKAEEISERLRVEMQDVILNREVPPLKLKVTASFGLCFLSEEVNNVHTLTQKADEALYQAKAEGKNRVIISS